MTAWQRLDSFVWNPDGLLAMPSDEPPSDLRSLAEDFSDTSLSPSIVVVASLSTPTLELSDNLLLGESTGSVEAVSSDV